MSESTRKIVRLVDKRDNCKALSALDLLKDLVADIEAGRCGMPVHLAMIFTVDEADGRRTLKTWRAGLGWLEEIGLYAAGAQKAIEDWKA